MDSESSDLDDFNLNEIITNTQQTQLNFSLMRKLLTDDVDNEDTLLELIEREDLPKYVLNIDRHLDSGFDLLLGLTNLIRRLMRIHDEPLNRWIGLELFDDCEVVSLFKSIFKLLEHYVEPICWPHIIPYSELQFSLYDYVASILCSLIMTLNEEQLAIVEDILFENLFSPFLINALMASDIFCFMCRISVSFTMEILPIFYQILEEIFFEDINYDKKNKTSLQIYYLNNQIILNLCKRIVRFLNENEKKEILQLISSKSRNLMYLFPEFDIESIQIKNYMSYEELNLVTRHFDDFNFQIILSSLVKNFITTTNEYNSLLHLRLLKNLRFKLDYKTFFIIIEQIKHLMEKKILSNYLDEFNLITLKILNALSNIKDTKFTNSTFIFNLYQLMLLLFQNSNNFISKFYYFITLQNICNNQLFENLFNLFRSNLDITTYLKFNLNYLMQKESLLGDEKDIYMDQMKDLFEAFQLEMTNFDEQEITIDNINDLFIHFTFLKENLQKIDDNGNDNNANGNDKPNADGNANDNGNDNNNDNDNNNNNVNDNIEAKQDENDNINLLMEFKKLIDKIENIKPINTNTKQQWLKDLERLNNIINNIDDNNHLESVT